MLTLIGSVVILLGWMVQAYQTLAKNARNMSFALLLLYMVGLALIVIDNFLGGAMVSGIINGVVVVLVLAIIIYIFGKK